MRAMDETDKLLRGALLGKGPEDPKLLRALALDAYLAELEGFLTRGEIERASELVARMRKIISWATT